MKNEKIDLAGMLNEELHDNKYRPYRGLAFDTSLEEAEDEFIIHVIMQVGILWRETEEYPIEIHNTIETDRWYLERLQECAKKNKEVLELMRNNFRLTSHLTRRIVWNKFPYQKYIKQTEEYLYSHVKHWEISIYEELIRQVPDSLSFFKENKQFQKSLKVKVRNMIMESTDFHEMAVQILRSWTNKVIKKVMNNDDNK